MVVVWVATARWRFPLCSRDSVAVGGAVMASRDVSNVLEERGDVVHGVGAFRARSGEQRQRRR